MNFSSISKFKENLKTPSLYLLIFFIILSPLSTKAGEPFRMNVLTSFLPIYIFTSNVVGDRKGVTIDLLIPGDVSPHDYQMKPSDMRRVERADVIILNGLGLESFLEGAINKKEIISPPFESAAKLPLITDNWDDHSDHHDHGHHHESEFNHHTWVSPKMAIIQVKNIVDFMSKVDPEGEKIYRENGNLYIGKLNKLQRDLEKTVQGVTNKKVVTFHSSFDYLARDVGLEIGDVIYKTSEKNISAGEMVSIIKLIKKNKIKVVFSEPQYSSRMADVLAKEGGAKVYLLDPVATGDADKDYYLKAMMKNLATLKEALQ